MARRAITGFTGQRCPHRKMSTSPAVQIFGNPGASIAAASAAPNAETGHSGYDPSIDVRKDVGFALRCKPFRGPLGDHEAAILFLTSVGSIAVG